MAISIPYSGYVSKLLNFVHLGLKFEQAWPLWGVGGLLLGLAVRFLRMLISVVRRLMR